MVEVCIISHVGGVVGGVPGVFSAGICTYMVSCVSVSGPVKSSVWVAACASAGSAAGTASGGGSKCGLVSITISRM